MTPTTHTPGPWTRQNAGGQDWFIRDDADNILAVVREQDVPKSIALANARLVAAAPDLLAACKLAHAFLAEEVFTNTAELAERIRAAIAMSEKK